jgi:osmotically-inducible protein OsmY
VAEVTIAPGPKVAGKRIPVPVVKREPDSTAKAARKTAAGALGTAASAVGGAASTAASAVGGAASTAGSAVGGAARSAGSAARGAGKTARGAGKTTRSASKTTRGAGKTASRATRSATRAMSRGAGRATAGARRISRDPNRAVQTAARSTRDAAETGLAALDFVQNVQPRRRSGGRRAASLTARGAPAVTAAIAAGAGAKYLLDGAEGKRRRTQFRDQAMSAVRGFGRAGARQARYAAGKAQGAASAATSSPREADDQTLADRVRSEIFRRPDAPKGQVTVGVVDAVVTLRGEVADAEEVRRLVDDTRAVAGVRAVQNLLHTPGVPAPTGGTA